LIGQDVGADDLLPNDTLAEPQLPSVSWLEVSLFPPLPSPPRGRRQIPSFFFSHRIFGSFLSFAMSSGCSFLPPAWRRGPLPVSRTPFLLDDFASAGVYFFFFFTDAFLLCIRGLSLDLPHSSIVIFFPFPPIEARFTVMLDTITFSYSGRNIGLFCYLPCLLFFGGGYVLSHADESSPPAFPGLLPVQRVSFFCLNNCHLTTGPLGAFVAKED